MMNGATAIRLARSGSGARGAVVFFATLLVVACSAVPDLDEGAQASSTPGRGVREDTEGGGSASGTGSGFPRESLNRDASSKPDGASAESGAPAGSGRDAPSGQGQARYRAADLVENFQDDPVLARVDNETIRASQVVQIFFMDNPAKTRDVLQNLVLYILVRREAERLGLEVEGTAVEALVDRLLKDQQARIALNVDGRMSLERFVRQEYGMSVKTYRDLIRRTAVFHLFMERLVRHYELGRRRLKLGVVIFKDLEAAEKAREKLLKGANFKALVKDSRLDKEGLQGEVWPPLPEDLDNPVVRAALSLKPGELSEVEETPLGEEKVYRLVKLIGIIDPLEGSYAELADRVEASLQKEPMVIPDLIRYWRESLEGRYAIEMPPPGRTLVQ